MFLLLTVNICLRTGRGMFSTLSNIYENSHILTHLREKSLMCSSNGSGNWLIQTDQLKRIEFETRKDKTNLNLTHVSVEKTDF